MDLGRFTPRACGLGTEKGRGLSDLREEMMGGGAEGVPVGMPETMDSRIGAVVRIEDFQEQRS